MFKALANTTNEPKARKSIDTHYTYTSSLNESTDMTKQLAGNTEKKKLFH